MATVKSKLKEQLQKEKDLAVEYYRSDPYNSLAEKWLDSIERIIKICKDRKRY